MDRPRGRAAPVPKSAGGLLGPSVALAAMLALAATHARAQESDRERAQMMQMQRELQRLQSDNASFQKERNELESKAQEADKLKKESEKTGTALAQARQQAAAQGRELSDLRTQLADVSAQLATARSENEALRKAVADRNDALAAAAAEKRRGDAAQALLAARLKAQTGQADVCAQRHDGLMRFTNELIDRYAADRLRLCEPVTGIWEVREQAKMQGLRDQLYGYRLDIPVPASSKAANATPEGAGSTGGAAPGARSSASDHSPVQPAPAGGAASVH